MENLTNIILTQDDINLIHKFENEPLNFTKLCIKHLKNISKKIWTDEIVNYIFDPNDTCLCSLSQRKIYKMRFYDKYNKLIKIADDII